MKKGYDYHVAKTRGGFIIAHCYYLNDAIRIAKLLSKPYHNYEVYKDPFKPGEVSYWNKYQKIWKEIEA